MADLPVACTLGPAALMARKANLLSLLLHRADERRELPNGYRLRFAPEGDILSVISQTVNAERQCCRFLRFTVTVEPADGPIALDLTGPAGTREFLAAMLELYRETRRFAEPPPAGSSPTPGFGRGRAPLDYGFPPPQPTFLNKFSSRRRGRRLRNCKWELRAVTVAARIPTCDTYSDRQDWRSVDTTAFNERAGAADAAREARSFGREGCSVTM